MTYPLALFTDGQPIVAPGLIAPPTDFWHRKIAITEIGENVIAGNADHAALNEVDRWIGGVHLTPKNLWRWNADTRTLVNAT